MTASTSSVRVAEDLLTSTARRFAADRFTFEDLRTRREDPDFPARIRDTWRDLGSLGWAGMLVPEARGGSPAGWTELGVVVRELGARLAITPLVGTGVVTATLLGRSNAPRVVELLERIAAGAVCAALAHQEGTHFGDRARTTTLGRRRGKLVLRGSHQHVLLGPIADVLLVVANREGAETVVVVDPNDHGVISEHGVFIDGQPVSCVRYDEVEVPPDAVVCDDEATVDEALVAGALAVAAGAVGGARRAFEQTVEYLRTREQFGVPIGAFQALQHRAAQLHCELVLAEAIVQRALEALDGDEPMARRLAHASKACVGETYLRIAEEGIQMHGGIGMTDEVEIGFHLCAARAATSAYGDPAHHRRRYATLAGY